MMDATLCIVCGKEASKLCSACQTTHYCSKEHQKLHWKEHKLHCKTFKEKWNVEIGHHLVASRDLKPGNETKQLNFFFSKSQILK